MLKAISVELWQYYIFTLPNN